MFKFVVHYLLFAGFAHTSNCEELMVFTQQSTKSLGKRIGNRRDRQAWFTWRWRWVAAVVDEVAVQAVTVVVVIFDLTVEVDHHVVDAALELLRLLANGIDNAPDMYLCNVAATTTSAILSSSENFQRSKHTWLPSSRNDFLVEKGNTGVESLQPPR
jgi:hypothetical protein